MEDFMQELKEQRIWMLWRFEIRKEKRTKVPKSAVDGRASGTDESWRQTWVTYEEAVAAKDTFGMDGVGFKIPDGYFFLDVDHRDLDDPLVQKLLTRFDSYAERSVIVPSRNASIVRFFSSSFICPCRIPIGQSGISSLNSF